MCPALLSEDLDDKRSPVPIPREQTIETQKHSGYASVESRDFGETGSFRQTIHEIEK
jgi:hypothetical protein